MFGWNVLAPATFSRFRTGMGNQLTHESIRVLEGDDPFFIEARFWMLELYMVPDKSLYPEAYSTWEDRK